MIGGCTGGAGVAVAGEEWVAGLDRVAAITVAGILEGTMTMVVGPGAMAALWLRTDRGVSETCGEALAGTVAAESLGLSSCPQPAKQQVMTRATRIGAQYPAGIAKVYACDGEFPVFPLTSGRKFRTNRPKATLGRETPVLCSF